MTLIALYRHHASNSCFSISDILASVDDPVRGKPVTPIVLPSKVEDDPSIFFGGAVRKWAKVRDGVFLLFAGDSRAFVFILHRLKSMSHNHMEESIFSNFEDIEWQFSIILVSISESGISFATKDVNEFQSGEYDCLYSGMGAILVEERYKDISIGRVTYSESEFDGVDGGFLFFVLSMLRDLYHHEIEKDYHFQFATGGWYEANLFINSELHQFHYSVNLWVVENGEFNLCSSTFSEKFNSSYRLNFVVATEDRGYRVNIGSVYVPSISEMHVPRISMEKRCDGVFKALGPSINFVTNRDTNNTFSFISNGDSVSWMRTDDQVKIDYADDLLTRMKNSMSVTDRQAGQQQP